MQTVNVQAWLALVSGIILFMLALILVSTLVTKKDKPKGSLVFTVVLFVISVVLVFGSTLSFNLHPTIAETFNSSTSKVIRVYEGDTVVLEIPGVKEVTSANNDVITYTTTSGHHDALRPGIYMVTVTEELNEEN